MTHPIWPLFDLEVRTPRLSLRYVDDELGAELARLAATGIHDPEWMPFSIPWTDAESPELERDAMRFYWRSRAETTVTNFRTPLAVIENGTVVGASDLVAADYPVLRSFETGSWLGRRHQGRGLGKELRIATLTLGFVGLDAVEATTGAYADNAPSLGVTRSLGYEQTRRHRTVRRDQASELLGFTMSREHFETIRRDDITLHGIDAVRAFLGISP